MAHNLPYAHDHPPLGFVDAIDAIKPHVLIGATGAPGTFTRQVVERMCAHNPRPVLFALSNPTSKAECTAEQAYEWSRGRAVFASGSPFGTGDVSRAARSARARATTPTCFPASGSAPSCAARVASPMSFFWLRPARSRDWSSREISTRVSLSAAQRHSPDFARDRRQRRRNRLRDEARARETSAEPEERDRAVHVRTVGFLL